MPVKEPYASTKDLSLEPQNKQVLIFLQMPSVRWPRAATTVLSLYLRTDINISQLPYTPCFEVLTAVEIWNIKNKTAF